jgi:hypothetical protein
LIIDGSDSFDTYLPRYLANNLSITAYGE